MRGITLVTKGFICQPYSLIKRILFPLSFSIKTQLQKITIKILSKFNINLQLSEKIFINQNLNKYKFNLFNINENKFNLNIKKCES